jgi:prepilin-type processing-associated H-X9-DG protein
VRSALVGNNGGTISNAPDGYDQRYSTVVATTMEIKSNGAPSVAFGKWPCVLDFGYGINGCVNTANNQPPATGVGAGWLDVPSTAVVVDAGGGAFPPLKKVTQFRRSAETVILFDGTEWNPMKGDANNYTYRISGSRHGKWDPNAPFTTGTTNVLFLDWHVDGVNRADLPVVDNSGAGVQQLSGTRIQMTATDPKGVTRYSRYIWNIKQQ